MTFYINNEPSEFPTTFKCHTALFSYIFTAKGTSLHESTSNRMRGKAQPEAARPLNWLKRR